MNHDNEVYMDFKCDDCENTFTKTFSLVEQK
jgi:plasmid replication initiation protein